VDELPATRDPERGFIATANHNVLPPGFARPVGFAWYEHRIDRIEEVLGEAARAGRKLGADDLAALQLDVVSPHARRLVAVLAGAEKQDPAAALLLAWDGGVRADSAAAALYEVWRRELAAALGRRLGVAALVERAPLRGLSRLVLQPDAALLGPSPAAERDRLAREALASAVEKLRAAQGADPARWSWGALHTLRLRHALDRLPGAAPLLDPEPVPCGGDGDTVNATYGPTLEATVGASFRAVWDLSDWDRGIAINMPGQSGNPGSPHYADLLPLWAAGRTFPVAFSDAAVRKASADRLLLVPGRR
jgi:penicillin G amidase